MERWIASLAAVSMVLVAAPTAALGETTESQHTVEASYQAGELTIAWQTSTGEERVERVTVPAEGPYAHAQLEVQAPSKAEMTRWAAAASDAPEDNTLPPLTVTLAGGTAASPNPCVQIYLPDVPPVNIDQSCVPDIGSPVLGSE